MKNLNPIVVFCLGVLVTVIIGGIMYYNCLLPCNPVCEDTGEVVPADTTLPQSQGLIISEAEFNALKTRFQTPPTPPTGETDAGAAPTPPGQGAWGGRIGRMAVEKLLRNLAPEEQFIEFKFGLSDDPVNPKTYLMFLSKGVPGGVTDKLYITNGGDNDSWCPMKCD